MQGYRPKVVYTKPVPNTLKIRQFDSPSSSESTAAFLESVDGKDESELRRALFTKLVSLSLHED